LQACQRQHQQVLSARAAAERKKPLMSRRLAKSTSAAAAPANSAETVTHPLEHAYNSDRSGVGCIDRDGGPGLLEALTKYCEQHSAPEPHTLAAVRDETLRLYGHNPAAARMLCDPLQGRVLGMLATITQAQRVLELGAFTGYSALALVLGIEGTFADTAASRAGARRKILSCEPDPTARSVALRHIAAAGLQGTVEVRPEKASVLLEQLRADTEQPLFDLVFVDADKKNYEQYVRTLAGLDGGRPLLTEGALIVVDNTLWKGLVLEAADASSTATHSADVQEGNGIAYAKVKGEDRLRELAVVMHKFNVFVAKHPQLQPVMLPLRDGLTVIRYSRNK
jgi:predicted O-methyltransferase YrrM